MKVLRFIPMHVAMRRTLLAAAMLATALSPSNAPGGGSDANVYHCAFYSGSFPSTGREDIVTALSVFIRELSHEGDVIKTDAEIFDSLDAITEAFREGRADLVSVQPTDYVRYKESWNVEVAFVGVINGAALQSYVLLAPVEAADGVAALRDRRLVHSADEELADLYLDSLIQETEGEYPDEFFASVGEDKPANCILQVLMKRADACLVREGVLDTLAELNPRVRQKLTVLARSAKFPYNAVAYRAGFPPDIKERMLRYTCERMHVSPRGQQVLMLFKLDRMVSMGDEAFDPVRDLLRERGEEIGDAGASGEGARFETAGVDEEATDGK